MMGVKRSDTLLCTGELVKRKLHVINDGEQNYDVIKENVFIILIFCVISHLHFGSRLARIFPDGILKDLNSYKSLIYAWFE